MMAIPERETRCDMGKGSLAGVLQVGVLWALQVTTGAQPAAVQVDLNADQRSLVIQLTAERAVTLAREHRLADVAQQRFYEQVTAKDQALRAAQARAAGKAAELARVREARDEIARQREALIASVEQRDRTLAAELSADREDAPDGLCCASPAERPVTESAEPQPISSRCLRSRAVRSAIPSRSIREVTRSQNYHRSNHRRERRTGGPRSP